MKILVLNCGSSSVKYKLFDIDSKSVLAQGGAEKIGLEDSFLKLTLPNGEKVILKTSMPEHQSGRARWRKIQQKRAHHRRSYRKNKRMLRYSAVAQSCQHGGYRSNI